MLEMLRPALSRRWTIAAMLAVCAASGACRGTSAPAPLPAGGRRILFIGNSLTYTNHLPATVAAIAAAAGDTLRVQMVAGPNLALIDHLTGSTNAAAMIRQGGWEYVVLQQGPTPSGICRDSLVLWTRMFEPLIRAAGGKPALLMTWPSASSTLSFDDIRTSFQQAAQAVNGAFIPAGEAWRLAQASDRTLQLYGADGFHPSPVGTFLAALVVFERLTGRDPRTLPPRAMSNGVVIALPEAQIRALQQAAHEANARFPAQLSGRIDAASRVHVAPVAYEATC